MDWKQELISVMIGYVRDLEHSTSSDHDLYLRLFPLVFDTDRKWYGVSVQDDGRFILTEAFTECKLLLSIRKISDRLQIVSPVMVLDNSLRSDEISAVIDAILQSESKEECDWIVIINQRDRAARLATVNSFFMDGYSSAGIRGLHSDGCAVYCWTKDQKKRGKMLQAGEPLMVLIREDMQPWRTTKEKKYDFDIS